MATIDKSGGATGAVGLPLKGVGRVFIMSNVVDLTGGAITAADVYQVLAIPAGVKVVEVCYESLTPAVGTTLTMNIGDGGATNGWKASVDGKGAAATFSISANGTDARAVATSNGYQYTTADSIDIVMTTATAITAGPKFRLSAWCVDYRNA